MACNTNCITYLVRSETNHDGEIRNASTTEVEFGYQGKLNTNVKIRGGGRGGV